LFDRVPDERLLSFGVPAEWLADVREANEVSLLKLADHLPGVAAEALLELATGGTPELAEFVVNELGAQYQVSTPTRFPMRSDVQGVELTGNVTDPFAHPDAQRRFRVIKNVAELEQALEYPWDKWTIFLHPAQRELVERDYNGPARVAGSAGTGKTVVALHRAVHLARHNRDSRVLLKTFSDTLSNALRAKLRRLLHHEPRLGENIEVHSFH
jgi:hypothetical protein